KIRRQVQFDSRHAPPRQKAEIRFINYNVNLIAPLKEPAVAAGIVNDYRGKTDRRPAAKHNRFHHNHIIQEATSKARLASVTRRMVYYSGVHWIVSQTIRHFSK
ncbi:MAG TPA: hypothetical protein P5032_11545, partial [Candidatus Competibacter sp.]|nr:hypothetical protein [Candidatus Competibacter sp.]